MPPAPEAGGRTGASRAPALTLVVPTYNEAGRLSHGVERLFSAAAEGAVDLLRTQVLIVDDGSTDGTPEVARALAASLPDARVVSHPRNLGKGAAVRTGMLAARGDLVCFADADMAIDPIHLSALVDALARAPVAVGSRAVAGHVDYGTRLRTDAGRAFNLAVRAIGGVHLADTQCGFKGFRRGAALLLAHLQTTSGYEFDVELLWLASRLDLDVEVVPVTWLDVPGSSVHVVHDSLRMLGDLVVSRRRRRLVAAASIGEAVPPGAPTGAVVLRSETGSWLLGAVGDLAAMRAAAEPGSEVRLLGLDELVGLRPFDLEPAA